MNEIKIISNNKMFQSSLERYINFVLKDSDMRSLILVDVNSVLDSSQKTYDGFGIRSVEKSIKDKGNIVILMSMEKEAYLLKNNEHFSALMAYSNVGFIDILAMQNILSKYLELSLGEKRKDDTSLALYEFRQLEKTIASLRHNMGNIENNQEFLKRWLGDARKAGLTGSDAQIIKYVAEWRPETSGDFKDKFLEGIFVDAFETLFDQSWCLVPGVQEAVQKMAAENKKYVFIISDSEKSLLESKLSKFVITWPLMSKYDIRGATLETVIDNLSQKDFESKYGILAQKFINVNDL